MSRDVVRFGLVSTARIIDLLWPSFRASTEVEVVAVASRSHDRAEEYAREHGIRRAHASYEALLADPDVDAVYIPLPNSLHVEWSIRALEAGKHVLCEKPMSRHPAGVERVFDVAEREGRILMEAFMYRHHPRTLKIAELIRDGAIGELREIRSSFCNGLSDLTDIRMQPSLEGGSLMDVGCYCVSVSRFLAGEPETVNARQLLSPTGVDSRLNGILTFAGGVVAHFDCGFDVVDYNGLEISGTEGVLRVQDPFVIRTPEIALVRDRAVEVVAVPVSDKYQHQIENFCRAVRGQEEPRLGRADAIGQARTIAALYRSAERDGVAVPVSDTGFRKEGSRDPSTPLNVMPVTGGKGGLASTPDDG